MNSIEDLDEFHKLIKYERKIFFKFTAPWCNPCKQIQPHLENVKQTYHMFN